MQWTPYEVKRLEYQLRIDAANRCPGTIQDDPEPADPTTDREPVREDIPVLRRIAYGINTLVRRRSHARAS